MKKTIKRVVVTKTNKKNGEVYFRQELMVENFDGIYYIVKDTVKVFGRTTVCDYTNDKRPKVYLDIIKDHYYNDGSFYLNVKLL